ncbi:MAG: hypothetical protein ACKVOR_14550 [Flavobacteriales bacterium]
MSAAQITIMLILICAACNRNEKPLHAFKVLEYTYPQSSHQGVHFRAFMIDGCADTLNQFQLEYTDSISYAEWTTCSPHLNVHIEFIQSDEYRQNFGNDIGSYYDDCDVNELFLCGYSFSATMETAQSIEVIRTIGKGNVYRTTTDTLIWTR